MMRDVFVVGDNIVSPLGYTTAENFDQLKNAISGIRQHHNKASAQPFHASLFDDTGVPVGNEAYTKFENILAASIKDALSKSEIDPADSRTLLIISTTKGNISLLEEKQVDEVLQKRMALHTSALLIAEQFKFQQKPLIVSHACISGLLAIITGMRFIQSGKYDHVVVAGADLITKFVLSGFQSFQAVSDVPCKPFDADRKGITLGEAAGTVILSNKKQHADDIRVCSGAVSNDANHISGPSRTGEELFGAIQKAMQEAGVSNNDIGFISAHGTATIYNDEMEAKAINLAGLQTVPVNSLKGYYGHTLGAAGLIESVISIQSLKQNTIIPTKGFNTPGVTKPVNICSTLQTGFFSHCLKTASGFGGCNAAVVFSKQ